MRTGSTMALAAAAAAALGCGGSLAAKTAPHVGCKSYEITTSDETRIGDAHAWMATCQGRWYRCSHAHRATECADASPGATSNQVRPQEDDAPKIARTAPPTGAGGFEFGAEIDAASRLCTGAGNAWKELPGDLYECSRPPADVGFAAVAGVEACDGRVCGVQIIADAADAGALQWVARYTRARAAFAQKYGGVYATSSNGMGGACVGDELGACFVDGRASASSTWTWRTGQTIELSVGKGSGGTRPIALRILYRGHARPGPGQPKLENL